jgi:hypothetical protein
LLAICTTFANAQEEIKKEKTVVVIKKTIDKDGNVTVERTVKEGAEIDDAEIEKLMREVEDEMEVEVTIDQKSVKKMGKDGKTKSKKKKKVYTIEIEEEDNDDSDDEEEHKVMIFKSDEGEENVFIMKDGEKIDLDDEDVKIIKMKGDGDEENIEIRIKEKMEDEDNVFIQKMDENSAFLGVVANPEKEGSLVLLEVVEDSPAAKAGLQKGDVVTSLNGEKLGKLEDLIEVLSALKPNDEVQIDYTRGSEAKTTKATLTTGEGKRMEKIIEVHVDESIESDGDKMIWIEKDGEEMEFGKDADEVIIEETIEESEENGKKIIKKTKVIKKVKN